MRHKILKLVKGVPAPLVNSESVEPGITESLSLLYPSTFAIDPDNGWTPGRAQPKQGIWTDVNTQNGRSLRAIDDQNVTETFIVNAEAQTELTIAQYVERLERLAQDARDFWQTEYQIDPVYIEWWAEGGAASQFALIYNMQIADSVYVDPSTARTLTITVEREPYWRAFAPGVNPKYWKLLNVDNRLPATDFQQRGISLNPSISLLAGSLNGFVEVTDLENVTELDTVFDGYITQNFVDIDAADIPGDAPALVEFSFITDVSGDSDRIADLYVWRSTLPRELDDYTSGGISSGTVVQYANFNGGDSDVSGDKSLNNCGVRSNNSAVNRYIISRSLAGSSSQAYNWPGEGGGTNRPGNSNLFRGRYAVFVRGRQSSGATGDIQVGFKRYESDTPTTYVDMPLISATTDCNDRFRTTYIGEFELPVNTRQSISAAGNGLINQTTDKIGLNVINNNASARTFEILDMVLVKLDEGAVKIRSDQEQTGAYVYDNTGYLSHGNLEPYASIVGGGLDTEPLELIGNSITLKPDENNRLYFMWDWYDPAGSGDVFVNKDITNMRLSLNIIPRWRGVRDV